MNCGIPCVQRSTLSSHQMLLRRLTSFSASFLLRMPSQMILQKGDFMNELFFILVGYLSGSILYAYLLPKYICHIDIMKDSDDHNPGTFNAFALAGTQVGILVIALELLKGFLPIWLASHILDTRRWMFAFVLCAPVAGHAFPLFYPKRGGKAIAVSFGVLLGLLPRYRPVLLLIFFYLLFSFLIVVKPHLYRSILTFTLFSLTGLFYFHDAVISMGTFSFPAWSSSDIWYIIRKSLSAFAFYSEAERLSFIFDHRNRF